jgi:hypothetical protein
MDEKYRSAIVVFEHLVRPSRQWFLGIISNRPQYEENVGDLTDIKDICNGMFMCRPLHSWFDVRGAIILEVRHVCHRLINSSHTFPYWCSDSKPFVLT